MKDVDMLQFAFINDFYLFFLEGFASFAGLTRFLISLTSKMGPAPHATNHSLPRTNMMRARE
jgi:hypothetical protein